MEGSHESGWERQRQGTFWPAGAFVGELSSLVGNLRDETTRVTASDTPCINTVLIAK